MSKGVTLTDTAPARPFRLVVTVLFILSLGAAVLMANVVIGVSEPIPTPYPTYTALVVSVVETREVTAVPTITRTSAPTMTRGPYLSPTPSKTPTAIWMSDPATGRMTSK